MSNYRYNKFTTNLLFRDLGFRRGAAAPGDQVPAFELITTRGERLVNDDVFGDKPVLFVFGSMTCPMTASSAPSVQQLYEEFAERVDFIMMYVREAHPGENYSQAESMDDKISSATALRDYYGIDWTVVTDTLDGDLHRALDPKPNAAYLMNSDGEILFRSLWAADYDALRLALEDAAGGRALRRTQSTRLLGPVVRAMGTVRETMRRGGPQAERDLWRAAFPMALAGLVATWFGPLAPDQRGIAAVLTMAIGMIVVLGVLSVVVTG
jgi:thiol-disulfide isomerase/thioredoxin